MQQAFRIIYVFKVLFFFFFYIFSHKILQDRVLMIQTLLKAPLQKRETQMVDKAEIIIK